MPRPLKFVTLDRVLSKLYRDLGLEEISETDVVEWSGEALEAIGTITLYEDAVAFMEVKNHEVTMPNGLHSVRQIARNNSWATSKASCTAASVILDEETIEIPNITEPCSSCPVPIDGNGVPITGYDLAYYRPYFDLQYEYSGWMNTNYYKKKFTPVRLANHLFFNTLVCSETEGLYDNSEDEYTVVEDKLRFSFKEGFVAVAYTRQKLDEETGYPLIPDDFSIISAITHYITWKYMARLWYLGREGYGDKMQEAERQWIWYCKQSGNKQVMPYGLDEYQDMLEGSFSLMPNHSKYYGFFGKLGRGNSNSGNSSINFRGV